jgi:hemolysin activation/secretion protein
MKKLLSALGLSVSAWCTAPAWAEEPATPLIEVMEFLVEGNSVLPDITIEEALGPFTGPGKTFKDLEAARGALERAYQDAGYLSVVVSLPNQRVDAGSVRLEVTEAKVERMRVTGAQYTLPSQVKQGVPSLAEGQVPHFPQVQRELGQVQSADRQVTPLIGAGDRVDAIDVELKVEDKPALHGSVSINNRQTFNTTRGRVDAAVSYSNLWQQGHSVGLSWQYAPWRPKDANTLTMLYSAPITAADDLSVSYTVSDSDTPTGTSVGGATVTRGDFWGLRWRHGLKALNWPVSHGLTLGVDRKDSRERTRDVFGFSVDGPQVLYTVLSASYDLSWNHGAGSVTTLGTTVAASTSGLSGRMVDCNGLTLDQFDCKRAGAEPDFLTWRINAFHMGQLWGGWRWSARLDAQISNARLVSGEQFSIGGADSVRGYYEYELSGDTGLAARFEALPTPWRLGGEWSLGSVLFADVGVVRTIDPTSTQKPQVRAASWGLGLRADHRSGMKVAVEVANPLRTTTRPADNGTDQPATRKGQWRVDVNVTQSF